MALALEGIKVVDVSQVAAAPMAARHLADFGADVIHVENPIAGDSLRSVQTGIGLATGAPQPSGFKHYWENYNRNKRSITVDASKEDGQKILYRLVCQADVYLTNMRPYEQAKFKLDYQTVSELNPKIIYGSLTGYGKEGTEKDAPGYDHTAYWPRTGLAHRVALAAGASPDAVPSSFVPSFGDNVAGLALAFGITLALVVRDRTGVGQEVDLSLFQTGVYHNSWDICASLVTGRDLDPIPLRENFPNPLQTVYQTKDKRWLVLCMPQSDRYWPRFCQAIGRRELENDTRFNSFENRAMNQATLFHIVEQVFLSRSLDEWQPMLNKSGLSWGPYQNFTEVIKDPQARDNDFFIDYNHPTYGHVEVVANPIKLSRTPATLRMPAPELGQNTEQILLELDYTWEDIKQLKKQGVIA